MTRQSRAVFVFLLSVILTWVWSLFPSIFVPPGHLHRSRPHGSTRAPHESHQRGLQEVQGKRPVQETGGHAGGALPLTFKTLTSSLWTPPCLPPSHPSPLLYLSLCEREEAAIELSVSPRESFDIFCARHVWLYPTLLLPLCVKTKK